MFDKPKVDLFSFLSNDNIIEALDKLKYTEGYYPHEIKWKQVAYLNTLPLVLGKLLEGTWFESKDHWIVIDKVHIWRTPKIQKPAPEKTKEYRIREV